MVWTIGITSRSTVRSMRLQGISSPMGGAQPRNSAMACIRDTCHAGMPDMPT
jgi:hypothetical protein